MALTMTVEVTQDGIEEAITDYLTSQGIETEGKDVDIEIIAGRKGAGTRATVSIAAHKTVVDTTDDCAEAKPVQDVEEEDDDAAVDAVMTTANTSNSLFDENVDSEVK